MHLTTHGSVRYGSTSFRNVHVTRGPTSNVQVSQPISVCAPHPPPQPLILMIMIIAWHCELQHSQDLRGPMHANSRCPPLATAPQPPSSHTSSARLHGQQEPHLPERHPRRALLTPPVQLRSTFTGLTIPRLPLNRNLSAFAQSTTGNRSANPGSNSPLTTPIPLPPVPNTCRRHANSVRCTRPGRAALPVVPARMPRCPPLLLRMHPQPTYSAPSHCMPRRSVTARRCASRPSISAILATLGPSACSPSYDRFCTVIFFWKLSSETPLYMRA